MSTLSLFSDRFTAEEELFTISEAAELLNVPQSRVEHLMKEHHLLGVKRNKKPGIPKLFFTETGILKHLPGLISVLEDGGYSPEEILEYLFAEDESLPGRPVDVLHQPRAREVMRRAQAMAL